MVDERIKKLARGLVNYSTSVKPGENVLIHLVGLDSLLLGRELIKEVYNAGGNPFVKIEEENIKNMLIKNAKKDALNLMREQDLEQMKKMDAYIAVRASENISSNINISNSQMELYEKEYADDVLNERVDNTKWVILRYPNGSMAQLAGMNTEDFEDFYFEVCNLDYSKMNKAMDNLKSQKLKTVSLG